MKITAIQNIRKFKVVATTKPRQYKIVVSSAKKQTTIIVAPLGKRGFPGKDADLSVLGNYERDWEQDFLIALNT